MGFSTVLRYAHAAEPEQLFTGQWQNRPTSLDAFKPHLDERWQEGCTNAWKLWEEITELGYPDGYSSVRAYVSRNLRGKPRPVDPRPPSARTVTRWILTRPEALTERDLPILQRFARNLERELDAVTAGLSQQWNSGVVEGHVNRIKMLKRQMFGRAGFELLRKRVLLAR